MNKHQKHIDELVDRLENKAYVTGTDKNIKYVMGECDILVDVGEKRVEYWEIKSNHTPKGYSNAIKQLLRWSSTMYANNSNCDYWGVYKTSRETPKVICKNGKLRYHIEKSLLMDYLRK